MGVQVATGFSDGIGQGTDLHLELEQVTKIKV